MAENGSTRPKNGDTPGVGFKIKRGNFAPHSISSYFSLSTKIQHLDRYNKRQNVSGTASVKWLNKAKNTHSNTANNHVIFTFDA